VKKIISILLALGLVLGLTVMATPVSADVTAADVTVDPNCAGQVAEYTISFNISASLTEGVHEICITFPDGTTVPATYEDGDITVEGADVFADEITVDGNTVCFLVPLHITAADNPVVVVFTDDAGIINPPAGEYTLDVSTSRAPDETPVASNPYDIAPAESAYTFLVDFGPTYPDIAEDFVPPFKACGQNDSGQAYNTTYIGDVWYDQFDLIFATDGIPGCDTPCDEVTISVALVAAPEGSTVDLVVNSTTYALDLVVNPDDDLDVVVLAEDIEVIWPSLLHFDTVGEYTLCFYADCGAPPPCSEAEGGVIVTKCYDFDVHQWKDAANVPIDEKWNLISLPLVPFDPDIENMLASLPAAALANLVSVWNYDRPDNEWLAYSPNGAADTLATIEDGKAYWFRMIYPMTPTYCWWVWGTEMPSPPAGPAEYPVYLGWNMAGFTSMTAYDAAVYLWNWAAPTPVVYGWTQGDWNVQGWDLVDVAGAEDLVPGQGYWMAFPADGAIYVPTP